MLIEARPLDVDHRVDDNTVASLFQEIVDNPPELPRDALSYDVTDLASAEVIVEDDDNPDGQNDSQ